MYKINTITVPQIQLNKFKEEYYECFKKVDKEFRVRKNNKRIVKIQGFYGSGYSCTSTELYRWACG